MEIVIYVLSNNNPSNMLILNYHFDRLFYFDARGEQNGEHIIMNYIKTNHKFVLGTYSNVPKIPINELDILRRNGINSDKIHWRIKFLLPAAHKYVTVWIKEGHPYIRFKKEMNWDSGIWYPGWRVDLVNIIRKELKEWYK